MFDPDGPVLLVSALKRELPPQSGTLRHVRMIAGGVGRVRAGAATAAGIDRFRPRLVVSIGYCGGVDVTVRVGDVLTADAVFADGRVWPAVPLGGPGVPLETVGRPLLTAAEKAAALGAWAVDMEAAGVAEACAEAGVPFAAVKVVTDAAEDDLPAGLEPFLTFAAGPGVGAGLRCGGALLRRPRLARDLWRLGGVSRRCSAALAAYLAAALDTRPDGDTEG